MTRSDSERIYSDPDLAWRVLGLMNLYRLLAALTLILLELLDVPLRLAGEGAHALFNASAAAWFVAGTVSIAFLKLRWPTLTLQVYLQVGLDIVALTLLLWTSLGTASGLGLLLVVPVGATGLLVANRSAFVIAAIAALAVLGQETTLWLAGLTDTQAFTQAGLLGAVIFTIALAAAPLANRLRESEALARQRELDLANLAELSQYVIERLRESLVVVDENDRIRLINDSARQILGQRDAQPGALLGEVSPRLLYLLETWRQAPRDAEQSHGKLMSADGTREIHAHFAPLASRTPTPVILFLEDVGALSERAQQSKLAALGRLSASIAHEIRNPVGAISHAIQLLGESPGLSASDLRLATIVRGNADRVNTIITNVLQLSRRESLNPERMPLAEWLRDFADEFTGTLQWKRERVALDLPHDEMEVRIDPSHLHQVLWNLCENAARHACRTPDCQIELRAGRLAATGRPFLEVADRGPGIDPTKADRIFEPFVTGQRGGTGLGLFIARELAQCNGALVVYEPRAGGGSIFRMIFADPLRWGEGGSP